MDNQIARDILSQTLESAKILNLDADYQQKLKTAIAKLPPMKVGQYGQLQTRKISTAIFPTFMVFTRQTKSHHTQLLNCGMRHA